MNQELTNAVQQAVNALQCAKRGNCDHAMADEAIDALRAALTQRPAAQEVERDPTKIEQAMRQAYGEFDSFLVGGCKGEPPRMSIAFASGLFKTIVREQGLFFTAPQQATPDNAAEVARLKAVIDELERREIRSVAQQATPEPPATRAQAEATDWRDRLTVNLLRQGAGLTKTQIRALIAHAVDGTEPDPALFQATPEPVGEPAAWRWFNSNGDQVTNWLDFKAAQKAKVEAQVAEAGGRIEYAYTRPAAAPAVPQPVFARLVDGAIVFNWPEIEQHAKDASSGHYVAARAFLAARGAAPAVPEGWKLSVSDSDGRKWLHIETPDGAKAALSTAATFDGGRHKTIAAQVLDVLAAAQAKGGAA